MFIEFPEIKGIISVRGKGKLTLGKGVKINSSFKSNPVGNAFKTAFYIGPNGKVAIGNNTGISNSLFYSIESIVIENSVLIGGGCQFLDNDFHPIKLEDRNNNDSKINSSPIRVHKNVFIGTSCIILKGVTIGENSIIGAGSVVASSIPKNEIWAGNPAKFIKKMN